MSYFGCFISLIVSRTPLLMFISQFTHHAFAEIIRVNTRECSHKQGQDVRGTFGIMSAATEKTAGHANHAAESGSKLVWLRQRLHSRIRPAGGSTFTHYTWWLLVHSSFGNSPAPALRWILRWLLTKPIYKDWICKSWQWIKEATIWAMIKL